MTPLNNSDKLDDLFRSKLKNIQKDPPKKSWNTVREQLNATNRSSWTTYAEGFVLICLVGVALYALFNHAPESSIGASEKNLNVASKTETIAKVSTKRVANGTRKAESTRVLKSSKTTSTSQNIASTKKQAIESGQSGAKVQEKQTQVASASAKTSAPSTNKGASKTATGNKSNLPPTVASAAVPATITSSSAESIQSNNNTESISFLTLHGVALSPAVSEESRPLPIDLASLKNNESEPSVPAKKLNMWHVGLTYSVNNTWIFNQNSYGEFNGSELNYKVDWGSSYGFSLGYDFKPKYGVQLEANLNSIQGQKYEDDLYFGHVMKEVNLHYTSFPLIFKYNLEPCKHAKTNLRLSYLLGLQYEHLEGATITVNENTIDATDRFKKGEFAGIIGLETNVRLIGGLSLSLGVRGSVSSNINDSDYPAAKTNMKILGNYNKSNNILLGANAGLNYAFHP